MKSSLPPLEAFKALEAARPGIDEAFAEGGDVDGFADVLQNVYANRMQLFATGGSVLITQVQDFPRARIFQLCYASGRLDEMEPWLDAVLEWGRRQGCTRAVMIGRFGWERTFLGTRLKPSHIVLEGTL